MKESRTSLITLVIATLMSSFISSCEEATKPDTTAPTVIITAPQDYDRVFEIVPITCVANDNERVEKVELWVAGVPTETVDDTEPYSLD